METGVKSIGVVDLYTLALLFERQRYCSAQAKRCTMRPRHERLRCYPDLPFGKGVAPLLRGNSFLLSSVDFKPAPAPQLNM